MDKGLNRLIYVTRTDFVNWHWRSGEQTMRKPVDLLFGIQKTNTDARPEQGVQVTSVNEV